MNGCIPVVPIFESPLSSPSVVYSNRGGCTIPNTYPFAKQQTSFGDVDLNDDDDDRIGEIGIDMNTISVFYNGTCGFECMKQPIEALLSNQTALQQRQLQLRKYAMVSTFGYTNESYHYPDAFMATIVVLRHLLGKGKYNNKPQAE